MIVGSFTLNSVLPEQALRVVLHQGMIVGSFTLNSVLPEQTLRVLHQGMIAEAVVRLP